MVAAKNLNRIASPYLFRSYVHPLHPAVHGRKSYALNPDSQGCHLETWEVCRATSAAPGYFKTFQTSDKKHEFMDGGIVANNPSMVAWNEAWHMAQLSDETMTAARAIGCLVSVGTGKSHYTIFGRKHQIPLFKYLNMNKAPKKMITDTVSLNFHFIHVNANLMPS